MGSSQAASLWVLLGLGLAGILIMTRKLKQVIREDFGAFVEKLQLLPPPQPAPPKAPHPLTGLTFAVSDVFDIEGHVTGFGHPDWAKTHDPASRTAPVVSTLVQGGATCIGKTVVDELAYSISGENEHYFTPTNPTAPSKTPGGSSSGAAVAVAANLADFSLGLDTVGWFAKDPKVLGRVGHVLLQLPFASSRSPRQIVIADDCLQQVKVPTDRIAQVVVKSTEKHFGRQVLKHENLDNYFNLKVPSLRKFHGEKTNGVVKVSSIKLLAHVAQSLQRHEFKQNHDEWINLVKPTLDPATSAQLCGPPESSDMEVEICKSIKNELHAAVNALLKDDGILVIPTVADPPSKLGGKPLLSEDFRSRAFGLLSIASLSGCCQVTIPLGLHNKNPVSVSFIARHGGDRFLLDTLQTMYTSLQEQADLVTNTKLSKNALTREQSAEVSKEKGNQAFKAKEYQKAIGFYSEAIKLSGNNATYYSNRAAAYLEIGSFLQAEADCSQAINLDKKNVKAYFRRGTAREVLGYYKEAIEDFKYAHVLEPTNKRAAAAAERLRKLFVQ
uniref:translocon at the outer membrane of chloroplasts 64 isoform X2 n=1 Tax=Fragaria vesca subsp. vesca TaxID=101020 RepID=UPI0005C8DED6|nr:PREDICTED: translocon at the outer membrane of chloroplasts 64 isoform X2 [Fragaria vesca subsp. vesca]